MKLLHQSLIDYEMAQLKAIADCRAVPLNTPNHAEAANLLAKALLSPAATAIVLADLSEAEHDALQALLNHAGRIERPRFVREYGVIRPMGPARLERERPWKNPVNPAESLWYKGLIFKAFQVTDQGNLEIMYIPDDLLELLKISEEAGDTADSPAIAEGNAPDVATLTVSQTPAPTLVSRVQDRLRENIFSLLVYLQITPVRLTRKAQLASKDKEALSECLLPPLLPAHSREAELEFLLHLGQRAGLLIVKHDRLRPDRDPTRAWLQAHPRQQARTLQHTWRADPTWNDLWHVPGLSPQPTGWENSPLLARSKILDYLAQTEAPADAWLSINDFIATVKRIDPDFQRPSGDYDSWYIQDADGRYLMGFENWDKVEGALIRYFLTHLLPYLGIVELGSAAETASPNCFRITPGGTAFLAGRPVNPPFDKMPAVLRVNANFSVSVPAQASLYDRFQLARFAALDRREAHRVVYQITRTSVGRAMRNGVTVDQIAAFLSRATNNQTPLKIVEALRTWGQRRDSVQIERVTLLRLRDEQLLAELRDHPTLRPLLGQAIGPNAVLIPADNVAEVRRLLTEWGYLEG